MNFCCDSFWLNAVIFIVGSWVLIKGSDVFIDAASDIARLWKVPELIIGLTLVSIGTSLPELSTSVYASIGNVGDFTIGNVVGSNVTNITLILGVGIVGAGVLGFSPQLFKRDIFILLGVYLLTVLMFSFCILSNSGTCSLYGIPRWGGVLLLLIGIAYCYMLFLSGRKERENAPEEEKKEISGWKSFFFLILGLIMVFGGSKAMVDTVVWGATCLGIPTLVISATIVAFGTSVPELAVTLAGVLKKQHDIAIGNIIGSNIFNIFLIFGTCAVIRPLPLAGQEAWVNIGFMLFAAFLLALFMGIRKKDLVRWQGGIFLLLYVGFILYNCKDILKKFL